MGTDVGAGTSFSMLQTGNEAYKIQQLQGQKFSAFKGLYLATLGGARALDLEGTIGNFAIWLRSRLYCYGLRGHLIFKVQNWPCKNPARASFLP